MDHCRNCGAKIEGTSKQKKYTGFGIASFVLSVIGICFLFIMLVFGSYTWSIFIFVCICLPSGILSIIFGAIGYFGKNKKDMFGMTGFILGLITICVGIVGVIVNALQYYDLF